MSIIFPDADDYNHQMKVQLPLVKKKWFTDKETGFRYWMWVHVR